MAEKGPPEIPSMNFVGSQDKAPGVDYVCMWCEEKIKGRVFGVPNAFGGPPAYYHRACLIRTVAGSVGHQKKLCSCYGGNYEDPPGLSRRIAAIAAWAEYEAGRRARARH